MPIRSEIRESYDALRRRKISSRELVEEALRKIRDLDGKLNSFLTVTGDQALAEANELDDELRRGLDRGLLHGIPRTASVRTSRECTLFRIGGQDFLSALQVSQPSPALLSVAGTRMARTPRNLDHESR